MASTFIVISRDRLSDHESRQKCCSGGRHTKRDLVGYYLSVGEGIVRALRVRRRSCVRFPDGIQGEHITRSACREASKWIEAARVTSRRPPGRRALRPSSPQVAWPRTSP